MTKISKYREAIRLRKQGKSYSQIKVNLRLSKSTLSRWLRKYPLNEEQMNKLREKSQIRIEKFRQTMMQKRQIRLLTYYNEERRKLFPLSERELFIAGLFLYWGEGNKFSRYTLSINNTDPSVLTFSLFWITHALHIDKKNIRVFLHLYKDMDIKKETNYWSKELDIDISQFSKPYIKKSKRNDVDQKGFGHGTCGIRIDSVFLKERILMNLKALSDFSWIKTDKI